MSPYTLQSGSGTAPESVRALAFLAALRGPPAVCLRVGVGGRAVAAGGGPRRMRAVRSLAPAGRGRAAGVRRLPGGRMYPGG